MIDEGLIFSGWNEQWHLFVVLTFIITMLISIDLYKNKRERKGLRILSYVLVLVSISGLILKPQYSTVIEADRIIFLTDGYDESTLDSLLQNQPNVKVYSKISEKGLNNNYQQVWDIYDLKYLNDNIKHIELLGEGLAPYELEKLIDININYYPYEIPNGILDLQYERSVELDKTTIIEGTIKSPNETKIILFNNDSRLDSTIADYQGYFSISHTLKATGRFVFQLAVYSGDSLLQDHPLPIEVIPQRKLSVLIVNDFPIFDTKYLRKYLVKSGHEVVIRNRYSQKNFNYEYYNTRDKAVIRLASDQLKNVDLLILDQQSLRGFSAKVLRNIRAMVKEYGLTVLLQNAKKFSNMNQFELFDNLSIDENNETEFVVKKGISISNSEYEVSQPNMPIVSTQSKNSLGGYKYLGIGKVGILSFQNSYELVLNGNQQLYESIWSDIIYQISKRVEKKIVMDFKDEFPIVNSQIEVSLENNTNQKHQVSIDNDKLPMKQDAQLPNLWTSIYWTNNSGWTAMNVNDTDFENYRYVFDENDWSSLISNRKSISNTMFAGITRQQIEETPKYANRELSPMIFYLLFLISIAYLWVETKL
jgi:hypothetical protein